MISANVNKGRVEITINGDTVEIAAELCCLVRGLYKTFKNTDAEESEAFKSIVIGEVGSGNVFSSKYDDLDDEVQREDNNPELDIRLKHLKELNELLEGLRSLQKELEKKDED